MRVGLLIEDHKTGVDRHGPSGRSLFRIHGVGVPPLKDLMDFLFAHDVRISVCEPSGRALGVTEDDFAGKNSGFGTSVDAANAYVGYDRVVTF